MKTLLFHSEAYQVRETYLWPSNLKVGDFIVIDGEILEVRTVQTQCPFIEDLHKSFVSVVTLTEEGFPKFLRSNGTKFHTFRRLH